MALIVPSTTCQFLNNTGTDSKHEGTTFWLGTGTPPPKVPGGSSAQFVHSGTEQGSVGAVSYLAGAVNTAKWIVAWYNAKNSTQNKVYVNIIGVKDPVDWNDVYNKLIASGGTSTASGEGYSSQATITQNTDLATMTASISVAP